MLGLVGFADDEMGVAMWVLSGAYGALVVVNLPIALLHLATGVRLRQGRGMVLALASIAASLVALITALYCSPLELIVVVWTGVTLLDPEVRELLDRPTEA